MGDDGMTDEGMGRGAGTTGGGAGPTRTTGGGPTRSTILAACLFVGVSLGVGVYMLAPIFRLEIPNRSLSSEEVDALFLAIRIPLVQEGYAEDLVEAYGWEALPFLTAVIGDTGETVRVRAQACLIAGKYRDEKAAGVIRAFLGELIGPGMSPTAISGAALALDGYGFCGTAAGAVADLEAMADLGYWVVDGEGPSRAGVDGARVDLEFLFRERAVRALGLAPRGGGIAGLKRVRGAGADLGEACAEALTAARRRRWGIDKLGEL